MMKYRHTGQRPWTHRQRSRKNINGFPKLFDSAFLLQHMETTCVAEDKARAWMEPFQLVVFLLFTRVSDSAHGLG